MISNVFDSIHRKSKSDGINLQFEFKINNTHYPNVGMV